MKSVTLKSESASTLLVTMVFVLTVGALIVGYMAMVQNSHQLIARAQYWNSALAIAEAGAEEGLAKLNQGASSPSWSWYQTINRDLNGGNYNVVYFNFGNSAWIYSTGVVTVAKTGDTVRRVVGVRARKSGMFLMGLVAINNIVFNGNSVASSSWNSYNPLMSTNGYYNGYNGTNGDVASVQGLVDIGNHEIKGDLFLGPNASYTAGPGGDVTGTIYTDANLSFPDVALPTKDENGNSISWSTASPTPITTTNSKGTLSTTYKYSFTSDGYYSIDNSYPVTVAPGVNVTLDIKKVGWTPGSIDINGGTTNSGNVVMYLESGSITLNGNSSGGAIANRPGNLIIFGRPEVTQITWSANSSYVGAIYAPEANLILNGGGSNLNFLGAAVVNTVTLNGHYNFHYDEALGTNGLNRGFVIDKWQEL